jgi:hypothetical protein
MLKFRFFKKKETAPTCNMRPNPKGLEIEFEGDHPLLTWWRILGYNIRPGVPLLVTNKGHIRKFLEKINLL